MDGTTTTSGVSTGPGTTAPIPTPDRTPPPPADLPLLGLDAETVARTLDNPVLVTSIPGDDRLFVIEKEGEIRVIGPEGLRDGSFLDLREVVEAGSLEQGLLGLAFHPDYNHNGRFFVYYTDLAGDSRLVEFRVSADPDLADPEPVRQILFQAQPDVNHNSGTLEFGPDGYLWVSLGDGGGAGDPNHNGQNPDTMLSAILRLDVDSAIPYAIPPDNPFADGGGEPKCGPRVSEIRGALRSIRSTVSFTLATLARTSGKRSTRSRSPRADGTSAGPSSRGSRVTRWIPVTTPG